MNPMNLIKLGKLLNEETKKLFEAFCVMALNHSDPDKFVTDAMRAAIERESQPQAAPEPVHVRAEVRDVKTRKGNRR